MSEWLASREQREERAQARAERATAPPDPEAQARRQAKREERVQAGLEELERWLHDLVRQGLAQARQRPYGFWDEAAARLVDAQASALAGRLRMLGGLAAAGREDWAEALLEEAGLVQLLLRASRRLDELPDGLRADVRALIGWTMPQDEVLAGARLRDRWAVLGRVLEEDEWPEAMYGDQHHMGTTKMHRDPAQGVVDPDCRMHEVENLWVAGSSVFPRAGMSNPTLTITALALRLAQRLRQELA